MKITEHELGEIGLLIEQKSGLRLNGDHRRLLAQRVKAYAKGKVLSKGSQLLQLLQRSPLEYNSMLEQLLAWEGSFFRYPDMYEAFETRIMPELHVKKFWENPRSLRIWNAGCGTGQEPYSLAILLSETLEEADDWQVHILATDLSRHALREAERGLYSESQLWALKPRQVRNCFDRIGDQYAVKPCLRRMVDFARVNLAQPAYAGRFDCIFCVDVLGYFGSELQAEILRRFYEYLEPGGYLFLGENEVFAEMPFGFQALGHGKAQIFQRPITDGVPARVPGAESLRATRRHCELHSTESLRNERQCR